MHLLKHLSQPDQEFIMRKIRSLLIDDNEFMLTVLSDSLKEKHPEIQIIGVARNGWEGIEKINRLQPDLIFLDIEMPDMNGFEMLNELEAINFQTIFTTAHSHYAIKAFRFNALDYLVKPIIPKELNEAVNRFQSNYAKTNKNQIQQALYNLKTENVEDQKFYLQTQKGMLNFSLKQIIKIEGDRNYSLIHLSDNSKELVSKTLAYFEEILVDKGFFRCHRSYLVNGFHIHGINKGFFYLNNGELIPISRRKRVEAKGWFSSIIRH